PGEHARATEIRHRLHRTADRQDVVDDGPARSVGGSLRTAGTGVEGERHGEIGRRCPEPLVDGVVVRPRGDGRGEEHAAEAATAYPLQLRERRVEVEDRQEGDGREAVGSADELVGDQVVVEAGDGDLQLRAADVEAAEEGEVGIDDVAPYPVGV